MSQQQSDSQQPKPLQTEASLEESTAQTIDVSATVADINDSLDPTEAINAAIASTNAELPNENEGFLLARKLRKHNRELVQTVVQLEQALAESQERLQNQITRARNADSILNQQAENLTGNQDEIDRLQAELKLAKADVREHRKKINELNQTLKRGQIQLAQVERECTLLRESFDEQHQKLIAAEQEIQDLQSRLQRQQRYTIQYKTALEKQGIPLEADSAPIPKQRSNFPKVSRIQPWSEQQPQPKPSVFQSNLQNIKTDTPDITINNPAAHQNPEITTNPSVENHQLEAEAIAPEPTLEPTSLILPPDINENLEQQLQDLEAEMAEMSKETLESPPVTPQSVLQFPPLQTTLQQSSASAPQTQLVSPQPAAVHRQPVTVGLPGQQKNWPSPTLNPLRTAKKRTSLAAVELPSFNRR